jgi:hypothetical protein
MGRFQDGNGRPTIAQRASSTALSCTRRASSSRSCDVAAKLIESRWVSQPLAFAGDL